MSFLTLSALFLFFMILSFFFSAAETSIIGLSKIRLRHMLTKNIKNSPSIQRLIANSDKFIVTILIGNNIANIAMSAIITVVAVQFYGYKWGALISTLLSAFIILIFCEISPKILALKNTEKMALFSAPIMEGFVKILSPLSLIFTKMSNLWLRIWKIEPSRRTSLITEEELRLMIEVGKEEGVLTDEERKMLHRIFEFGDIKVGDVMIPKEKIVAVDIKSSAEAVLDILAEQGHARLPVYRDSLENIVGILYARDLLYILRDKGLFLLQDLTQKPCFVPSTMRVNELLRKFQVEKLQIAIVVGEDKKTQGVVTLEDLIEEIVGEIEERPSSDNHK